MQKLFLKIFLCLSGLLFGFSILTETAFLQNTQPSPKPTPRQTPRPKKKTAVNKVTTVEETTIESEPQSEDVMISNMSINSVPTPTPVLANSTVRGRVFYSDTGRAVKRAPLMLMREKGFGGPGSMMNALTDGDGNFQMKNVPAGVYYAMINAPGVVSPMAFVDFSKARGGASEAEEFEKASEGFEKIIVDGVNDLEVQIPARRGGAIGGRIMYDNGDPAIGIKVEILRKADGKFLPVIPNFSAIFSMISGSSGFQTDDRGVYRFSGLPAGEYILKVTESASHTEGAERRSYNEFETMFAGGSSLLSIFYPDVFEPKAANIINLELGQEITEVNMTIPSRSLYKIEGKIVARKDKSPVKARVTIKREGGEEISSIFTEFGRREQSSVSDENGNWKFKELPKGTYKLTIEQIQSENEYREYQGEYSNSNTTTNAQKTPLPKLAKKVQEIKLEDKDISEMVIELGSGATIAGTIAVENSETTPAMVTIRTVNENTDLASSDTVSAIGSGGHIYATNTNTTPMPRTPPKPDRDFRLENVAEGKTYFYVEQSDDYYVKSAKAGAIDLLAAPLDLKDGDALENVQIIFSKEMGAVKGKIVDANNQFLKNGVFILIPTDAGKQKNSSFYRSFKADEKGEFEKKVAPGEYAVLFSEQFSDQSGFGKNHAEFFKWLVEAVKDAQKVTVEAGRTENLTVKKIKR